MSTIFLPLPSQQAKQGLARVNRVNRVNFGLPLGSPLASLGQTRLAKQLTRQTREWLPRLFITQTLTLNTSNGARSKNEISAQTDDIRRHEKVQKHGPEAIRVTRVNWIASLGSRRVWNCWS